VPGHRPGVLARRARIAAVSSLTGLVLGPLLIAPLALAFGARSYVVRSGSMTPAIRTGDVVVAAPIAPLAARVGDIVTFREPNAGGRLLSHRVRAVHQAGRAVEFTTQGDANTGQEHWTVPLGGHIGKVLYRAPKLGYAVAWTGTPAGRTGLIAIPALLLCLCLLARIWNLGRLGEGERR
jgi:signal peptidase